MKWINLLFFFISLNGFSQTNTTPTYNELIVYYSNLAKLNPDISLFNMGESDYGEPIYLCVLGAENDSISTFESLQESTTLLINNAIHAGEPCGVNASIQIVKEYVVLTSEEKKQYPKIAIIPAYNVGGMYNRSSTSRANQVGPEEYGFRGNAQNLDLNRDFIKMDSRNMEVFAKIYHGIDPDVFIDTHTSNGADYQYTITYIASLRERMSNSLADLVYDEMLPELTTKIKSNYNYDLFPYISMAGDRIREGIVAFNDLPRYSMGYCNLFNTISFTTETHMLKPFEERVRSTFAFIKETIDYMQINGEAIEKGRVLAFKEDRAKHFYTYNYVIDSVRNNNSKITFKGYDYQDIPSRLTPQKRLFYNRAKPFEDEIPFYFHYSPQDTLRIPTHYIIGKQAKDVIQRLKLNGVDVDFFNKDTTVIANRIKVNSYETRNAPYEGHYLHYNTKVERAAQAVLIKKGDILIKTDQKKRKFIVSVLAPETEDSYFSWNFFDSYLQQKEYFSPYVFEEKAIEILDKKPELKIAYNKKQKEEGFVDSRWNQLYFIYKNSPYYEPTHLILPVFELN